MLGILTSAAVGSSFPLWSWLCVRIKLENCVCRWWILALAWLGAHEGRTCPSPSRFGASFGLRAPSAVTWPLLHPEVLLSCWCSVGWQRQRKPRHWCQWEADIFPLCFCKEWRKQWKGRKLSLIFNGWRCYNHFVGLQSPALNLEGTFLLGCSNTFCLSLLSIWQPLRLRDSSLLIIPGSSILNFYGLRFAAPEPQYITCTVAVEWELQQGCMSFSKWII